MLFLFLTMCLSIPTTDGSDPVRKCQVYEFPANFTSEKACFDWAIGDMFSLFKLKENYSIDSWQCRAEVSSDR
jgi:hypothetical protein